VAHLEAPRALRRKNVAHLEAPRALRRDGCGTFRGSQGPKEGGNMAHLGAPGALRKERMWHKQAQKEEKRAIIDEKELKLTERAGSREAGIPT